MAFVKLDTGLLRSSLWVDRDHRSLFLTALLMAEPFEVKEPMPAIEIRSLKATGFVVPPGWYGFIRAAGVGIVRTDGMEKDAGLDALEALGQPDPESRSQDHEGRRLVRVDGGFIALNYFKYRDRDYTAADRMRRLRERRKAQAVEAEPDTPNDRDVRRNDTQAEAEGRGQRSEAEGTKAEGDLSKGESAPYAGEPPLVYDQKEHERFLAGASPVMGEFMQVYYSDAGAERIIHVCKQLRDLLLDGVEYNGSRVKAFGVAHLEDTLRGMLAPGSMVMRNPDAAIALVLKRVQETYLERMAASFKANELPRGGNARQPSRLGEILMGIQHEL